MIKENQKILLLLFILGLFLIPIISQECLPSQFKNTTSNLCQNCYASMSGCASCTSSTVCLSCIQGYFLDVSTCKTCTSQATLKLCSICNATNYCLVCFAGYYNDTGVCKTCDSAMVGCLTCNTSTVCIQCHSDYFLHTDNKCYLCDNSIASQPNCLKCNSSSYCLNCKLGYFTNSGNCQACSTNCLVCQSSTNCTQCNMGYYENSNVCTTCGSLCLSCGTGPTNCSDCIQGYYSASGTCTKCTSPCLACNTSAYCFSCVIGYYDNGSGGCVLCNSNCASCSGSGACLSCSVGYYISGTSCLLCSNLKAFCAQCTNTTCTSCVVGFYYDSGTTSCKSCQSQMYSCLSCNSSSNCHQCGPGTYSSGINNNGNSSCLACAQGCATCFGGLSTNCRSCVPGFYYDSANTRCLSCNHLTNHCTACSLTGSNCSSCDVGYFLELKTAPTQNLCRQCSVNITGCLDCYNQTYCIGCRIGMFLNSSNLCQKCVQPCITCQVSSSQCLSCEQGYYYLSTGIPNYCISCSRNCTTCETSTNCTQCIPGFYLSTTVSGTGEGTCQQCSQYNCLTCVSPTQCLSCRAGTYLNSTNQNCTKCISKILNCLECTSGTNCLYCSYGYILSLTGSSCISCSQIPGCSHCKSTTACQVCLPGFYHQSSNDTCMLCQQGCSSCTGAGVANCLTCQSGFIYDSSRCTLCQNLISGCLLCTSNTACVKCLNGYYLDPLGTQTCFLCKTAMKGCSYCNNTSTCLLCQDGYFLDTTTSPPTQFCQRCSYMDGCQLCNSSSICLDCQTGYYLSVSNQCNTCLSIPGCISCANISHCFNCKSGYYLDSGNTQRCLLCQAVLPGCSLCSSSSTCLQCEGGFYLNSGNNQCSKCNQKGCQICQESNPNNCVTCNSGYYMDNTIISSPKCNPCSILEGCIQCQISTQCQICDSGFYLDTSVSPNICKTCSKSPPLIGCMKCTADGSRCLQCKSSFFLNASSNVCSVCSQSLIGCSFCVASNQCLGCSSGYYLNSSVSPQICEPCTAINGCIMCKNQTTCVYCKSQYYVDSVSIPGTSQCKLCSDALQGCFGCASQVLCTSCQGGYTLNGTQCKALVLTAAQPVTGLLLKSYIVDAVTLKHILFAQNMKYSQIQQDWQAQSKITLVLRNGTSLTLTINKAQYGSNGNDLIFYTDNPLNLSNSQMPLIPQKRLLQQIAGLNGLDGYVNLDLSQKIMKEILPNFAHSGNLVLDYDLTSPQFFGSYMKLANWGLYYIYGIIITIIMLIWYFIQTSILLPYSQDKGNIIPHIFALKTGVLALYPTYVQYLSFCWGFMTPDFPWLNSFFGSILSDAAQYVPAPYAVFYPNMSIASTYLLALGVILLIMMIAFIIFKCLASSATQQAYSKDKKILKSPKKQIQKIQDRYSSFRQFNYNFFVLGVIVASSVSFQGTILNPFDQVSLNAAFYIIGIIVYLLVIMECFWSILQSVTYFYKLRILIKGTLLSVMHFSPIYIAASAVIIDIIFAVGQFFLLKQMKPFPKLWLFNNILINISLTILIYLPYAGIGMIASGTLVLIVLASDISFHVYQYCNPNQSSIQCFKQTKMSYKTKNQTWFTNIGKTHRNQSKISLNDKNSEDSGKKYETQENLFFKNNTNIWDIDQSNDLEKQGKKYFNQKQDNLDNQFSKRSKKYDFDKTQQTMMGRNTRGDLYKGIQTRYHSKNTSQNTNYEDREGPKRRYKKEPKNMTKQAKSNQLMVNSFRLKDKDQISQDSDIFAPGDFLNLSKR